MATLEQKLQDPGFTPGRKDAPGLVALLSDDRLGDAAVRALVRMGPALAQVVVPSDMNAKATAQWLRVLARSQQAKALPALREALGHSEERVVREAVVQIGKVLDPKLAADAALGESARELEQSLLELGKARRGASIESPAGATYRAVVDTLGKVGTEASLAFVHEAPDAKKAQLRLGRVLVRGKQGEIREQVNLASPVWLYVRRGLEGVLASEVGGRVLRPEVVQVDLGEVENAYPRRAVRTLKAVRSARLWHACGFPLGTFSGTPEEALMAAFQSQTFECIVHGHAHGVQRYRIEWPNKGRRMAGLLKVTEYLAAERPEWVNDPRGSDWEFRVDEHGEVTLLPIGLADERFAYRRATVPASSHPTIAAALAYVAAPKADDVVWDPFAGAGTELRECYIRQPSRRYIGTDTSEAALEAARGNLVGLPRLELNLATALQTQPEGVTIIVSNPPMGRRVERHAGLRDDLCRFVAHAAAKVLRPGGRLIWLAPYPEALRNAGHDAGLTLQFGRLVDLGGFDAELQHWIL